MKYLIVIIILFVSCNSNPIYEIRTNNQNINVDFLFEHDGIRVYRFEDGGRSHYFTSKGKTISTQSVCTGKTITFYDEEIDFLEDK